MKIILLISNTKSYFPNNILKFYITPNYGYVFYHKTKGEDDSMILKNKLSKNKHLQFTNPYPGLKVKYWV